MRAAAVRMYLPSPSGFLGISEIENVTLGIGGDDEDGEDGLAEEDILMCGGVNVFDMKLSENRLRGESAMRKALVAESRMEQGRTERIRVLGTGERLLYAVF